MNQITEFLLRVFLGRIVIETFGYYTLLGIFKLFNSKKGLDWLKGKDFNDLDAFNQGCFVAIVGMASFFLTVTAIFYLIDFIGWI